MAFFFGQNVLARSKSLSLIQARKCGRNEAHPRVSIGSGLVTSNSSSKIINSLWRAEKVPVNTTLSFRYQSLLSSVNRETSSSSARNLAFLCTDGRRELTALYSHAIAQRLRSRKAPVKNVMIARIPARLAERLGRSRSRSGSQANQKLPKHRQQSTTG